MRNYEGNPESGGHWMLVGEAGKHDGALWLVAKRKKPTNDTDWRMVKVSAVGRAPRKANYWLSWDGKRFARGKDIAIMASGRPELLAAVHALFAAS